MIALLMLLAGVILLYLGAESLLRGASHLAITLGMSEVVCGLTVVALGTSMPEAVASTMAQIQGEQGNIAMGNIIGSNIANIGLILGIAVLCAPITISEVIHDREIPLMAGLSLLLGIFMLGGTILRWEGIVLLAALCVYLFYHVFGGRIFSKGKESAKDFVVEKEKKPLTAMVAKNVTIDLLFIVVGILLLVSGGAFLVEGAERLAKLWGVSERVIGLTMVALGTSLPELATSIVAAVRKKPDIALGNIVGSNIFNLLFVAGIASTVVPIVYSKRLLLFDLPVMLGFTALLWGFSTKTKAFSKPYGIVLIALYASYVSLLFFVA
ncbi:calcium/sodium antiporter [Simkania negevensis]|uniref:Calcium/sodium antiporter n=1 Tax=Simkania negevensis TaxID=83561 RepID=A0ABS3ASM0_9BACT|nr:calcium/sodium antiporter [Simkania negevensis]